MNLSSKQRAYLKSLAANESPIMQIGKSNLTPEITDAVANSIADRTRSTLVQVIGRKIVLYKENKDNKVIELPR